MFLLRSRSPVKRAAQYFAMALVACAILGQAQLANAGSIIEWSLSSGSGYVNLASDPSVGSTGVTQATGSVLAPNGILITGGSVFSPNWPGTTSSAIQNNSAVSLSNTSGSTQTIFLVFGIDSFTKPLGAAISHWTSIGGSVSALGTTPGANSISITSWVNVAGAEGALGSLGLSGNPTGPVGVSPLNSLGSFASPQSTATLFALGEDFAINQRVAVTLSAGASINFAGTSNLQFVPEPASMTMLGIGLVGMAGYGWRKRRQLSTQTVA